MMSRTAGLSNLLRWVRSTGFRLPAKRQAKACTPNGCLSICGRMGRIAATRRRRVLAGLIGAAGLIALATQCSQVQVVNTLNRPAAGLFWPQDGSAPRVRFLSSIRSPDDLFVRRNWFGLADVVAGKADRAFSVPFDVHMGRDDLLLVTDPGKCCVHFIDMRARRYQAVSGLGQATLQQPIGVTTDAGGLVYVSDSLLENVFVFDRQGRFVRALTPPGTLKRPAGLAYGARTGCLYVADVIAHQVKVFRPDGTLVGAIGSRGAGPGQLNYPTHVWVDDKGVLYVTSSLNFSISVFDPSGNFLASFGKEGDAPGYFTRPKGVATDRAGHIYVVDAIFDAFQIFNDRGALLAAVGSSGSGDGEFWLPAGIFIDSRNRIFVADQQNHRIEVFQYVEEATR